MSITHVPISAPPCVVASGAPSKRLDGTEHLFPGPARGWFPVCRAPEQKEGQAVGGHGACPSSGPPEGRAGSGEAAAQSGQVVRASLRPLPPLSPCGDPQQPQPRGLLVAARAHVRMVLCHLAL